MTDIAYQIERMEERAIQLKNQVRQDITEGSIEKILGSVKEVWRGDSGQAGDLWR